jgi:hypothetical protein
MPAPASHFDGAISVALKAPAAVRQREQLTGLDVVMTNEGEEPFVFQFSGNLLDFEVLDPEGVVIWSFLGGWDLPLGNFTLKPGESQALSRMEWSVQGKWGLRDRQGFPVPPGEYGIRGVARLEIPGREFGTVDPLRTSVHTLTVEGVPLPAYAQDVELELLVPDEAKAGKSIPIALAAEPIPIDLRVTNNGEKSLSLWWSGVNTHPRFNYLNIYAFRNGEPIWDVISVIDIDNRGMVTLEPGESRTLSSFTLEPEQRGFEPSNYEGTGEPWLWNQRADCGKYPGNPCGHLVEPGVYTVRAVVTVSEDPSFSADHAAIATDTHQLVITEPDDADVSTPAS